MAASDADLNQPTAEEQQALLQSNPDSTPMASDLTRPESRKGDASASALVWVCLILALIRRLNPFHRPP